MSWTVVWNLDPWHSAVSNALVVVLVSQYHVLIYTLETSVTA